MFQLTLACRQRWQLGLALSGVLFSLGNLPTNAASVRVVALTGDAAPGMDAEFLRFGPPVINATNDVAFQSFLSGATTDVVPHGVFVGTTGGPQLVAVAGHIADGGGGARFRTPGTPHILTADRQTLFYGNLIDELGVNTENDYGLWAGQPADVQLIARRGEAAPNLPEGVNYSLFIARPTSYGLMGLSASLQGSGVDATNNSAAFVGPMTPAGGMAIVARSGDIAPGLPPGSRFIGLSAPAVNPQRQFVLNAIATNGAQPGSVVTGIWGSDATDFQLLVSSLSSVSGASNRSFSDFGEAVFNRHGSFSFQGSLAVETDDQLLSDVGLWAGDIAGNELELVALEGDAAPEFGATAVFHGSSPGDEPYYRAFSQPVLSGSGRVALAGTVWGEGIDFNHNDGVWVSDPLGAGRERALVAREGEQPPDTPAGTRFVGQDFGEDLIPAFERPLINASGQVAFEATTSGPWGDVGQGVFGTDKRGELHLLAHTGMQWEIAPGDWRTISLLKMHAGGSSEDGLLSAINDAGLIALSLNFTDGTEAVVVATLQPGDTDADGDVDLEDLNNVRNYFGGSGPGDTNHDGIVDLADLNAVRNHFGDGANAVSAPEPAAWIIATIAALWGVVAGACRRNRDGGRSVFRRATCPIPTCADGRSARSSSPKG